MNPFASRLARIEKALTLTLPDHVDGFWLELVAGGGAAELNPGEADRFLEPGRILLRRGGKRWRPLVTLLTCEALGGGEAADLLAPMTEISHNGSLIVDDIEDGSETRRGGPAIHLECGEDLAINMGNLMYFLPTILLANTPLSPENRTVVLNDWLEVMRRLHLGQGYDILWHRESRLFPSPPAYLKMCRFKTGSLALLAARFGCLAAEAPENITEALGRAWEDIGLAFQILDDVRNITLGIPGKKRADDIVEGKKSLPVILHVQKRDGDAATLAGLFDQAKTGDASAVEEALALLHSSGAVEEAEEHGRDLLKRGREVLKTLLPDGEACGLLMDLVDAFMAA